LHRNGCSAQALNGSQVVATHSSACSVQIGAKRCEQKGTIVGTVFDNLGTTVGTSDCLASAKERT